MKSYNSSISKLRQIDSNKTKEYIQKFETTKDIIDTELNTGVPKQLPQKDHAIIILGYREVLLMGKTL